MFINFNDEHEFTLSLDKPYTPVKTGCTNVSVSLDADNPTQLFSAPTLPTPFYLVNAKKLELSNGFAVSYEITGKDVVIEGTVNKVEGLNVLEQFSTVKNNSKNTYTVTESVAGNVNGICYDDNACIYDRLNDGSIVINYCLSKWTGEAQWRTATPDDLGIMFGTSHPWERAVCRIDSVSSWSTSAYYPILIIEDKKKNQAWFFEILAGHNWLFEIYAIGGYECVKSLSVKMGGGDERLGVAKILESGKTYSTCTCIYGLVNGGFEEAVRELTAYKRKTSLVKCGSPVVYNDYMNCNWAQESAEKLIPLIDKAAEVGAEIFCIDDGWQVAQGYWYPDDSKFGEYKLQGIIDYIKSKGLIPGIWFEFETIAQKLPEILGSDEVYIRRNGKTVASWRYLGNFRSKLLLDYLNERVDALYDMGVRYIKNDHNNAESIGNNIGNECPAEGLENNYKAFLEFIDGIYERHPDMIIENCGSGAMRSDYGTLKHFNLQSISDQENYLNNVSVLSGSLAVMPVEKAGVWACPYPLVYDNIKLGIIPETELEGFRNGNQTTFNIACGLLGNMFLSGKYQYADEFNLNLIKEGVSVYKELQEFKKNCYPIYPCGTLRLSKKEQYSFGLISEDFNEIVLGVFNLASSPAKLSVDLSKYGMNNAKVLYPSSSKGVEFNFNNNVLNCSFAEGKLALVIKLSK